MSWAGMTYLTLFLCSKFAISVPYFFPQAFSSLSVGSDTSQSPLYQSHDPLPASSGMPTRNRAATPPTVLLNLACIPIGAALYISGTRWSDTRHHGSDIVCGSLLGFGFAWLGFRLYHIPIRQGADCPWGARGRNRAFSVGVGEPSYMGDVKWDHASGLPGLYEELTSDELPEQVDSESQGKSSLVGARIGDSDVSGEPIRSTRPFIRES